MKTKHKELLLKDLCARLPYGVALEQTYKVTVIATSIEEVLTRTIYLYAINSLDDMTVSGIHNDGDLEICFFEEIKPYLFPLSSMTEEQRNEYDTICAMSGFDMSELDADKLITFFHENHIDYRGLIEKGLAIDATNLNIYEL